MNSALYTHAVWLLLLLFVALYFTRSLRDEGFGMAPGVLDQLNSTEAFGMSPGVMDQLASTRVVTKRDEEISDHIYDNLTRQGIINMTETGYAGSEYASTASDY